jgi:hypothetical protein
MHSRLQGTHALRPTCLSHHVPPPPAASATRSSTGAGASRKLLQLGLQQHDDPVAAGMLARYSLPVPANDGSDEEEQPPAPDDLPKGNGPASQSDLEILDMTNEYRANHGAPPLAWDPRLAAGAEYLTSQCPPGHSGARGLGENMARGVPNWAAAVKGWYDESAHVNWSSLGWNSEAGQFTQMVWRDTKAMGCAVDKKCENGALYVCFYEPSGNLIGVDWTRHVLPPATKM